MLNLIYFLIIKYTDNYFNLSINRSPTLRALAIIVKAGLTAALDGKKLPSTI
jgi:hypothetical protein